MGFKGVYKNMYIKCKIEYVDDGSQLEVIIKANNKVLESEDDYIFFYGLTENQIKGIIDKNEICEGEWKILEIMEVSDDLWK